MGVSWVPEETSSYIYKKQEYLLLLSDPLYRYEATYKAIPLGMEEPMVKGFSVYPNPADDFITVISPGSGDPWLEVRMFDSNGKEVTTAFVNRHSGTSGSASYTIDTKALTNGLYLLSARSGRNTHTQKVVIQH